MPKITLDKNTLFSLLLILVTALIINRLIPPSVEPILTLTISKNRVNITHINQARDISASKEVKVDVLNLAEKSRFMHPTLGEIGYGDEFFVDINSVMQVKQPGRYQFFVGSDDGFILTINGREICRFNGSRALATQTCNANLNEGANQFQLNYYQGYGNAGLKVEYRKADSSKRYWVGENSAFIKFD